MIIKFRPHHFLCSLGFQGKGYSPQFISNYQKIIDALEDSANSVLLQVVEETDAVCAPCPYRRGKRCATQDKIDKLDQAHAKILNLRSGDLYTWAEAKERIKQFFTLDAFDAVCKPCAWERAWSLPSGFRKSFKRRKNINKKVIKN